MREDGRRGRTLVGRTDGLCAHVAHDRVAELLVRRAELEGVHDPAEPLGVVGVRAAEEDRTAVLMQERLEPVVRCELFEAVDELVERADGRVDLGGQGEGAAVGRGAGPGPAGEGVLTVDREGREERRRDHGVDRVRARMSGSGAGRREQGAGSGRGAAVRHAQPVLQSPAQARADPFSPAVRRCAGRGCASERGEGVRVRGSCVSCARGAAAPLGRVGVVQQATGALVRQPVLVSVAEDGDQEPRRDEAGHGELPLPRPLTALPPVEVR